MCIAKHSKWLHLTPLSLEPCLLSDGALPPFTHLCLSCSLPLTIAPPPPLVSLMEAVGSMGGVGGYTVGVWDTDGC